MIYLLPLTLFSLLWSCTSAAPSQADTPRDAEPQDTEPQDSEPQDSEPQDWALVWSDEFDQDGPVDASKWDFEEGFVRNEELQWYQADNAFVEGGVLVIEGRRESRDNPGYDAGSSDWRSRRERIEFSSASLTTKGLASWQYGRVLVRAKVSNSSGTWPAIWTLGERCDWPSSGEVDLLENYGGQLLANFAWGSDKAWTPTWNISTRSVASMGQGWVEAFHVWELEWSAQSMSIYLDGVLLNQVDLQDTINGSAVCAGENPFHQPQYLLLSLALGSNGGSVEDLDFPSRFLVDYVRVYERVGG